MSLSTVSVSSQTYCTGVPVVPRQPEPVGGQVEVLDLLRQDGGVALFPAGDGDDVARLVLRQTHVLNSGQVFYNI